MTDDRGLSLCVNKGKKEEKTPGFGEIVSFHTRSVYLAACRGVHVLLFDSPNIAMNCLLLVALPYSIDPDLDMFPRPFISSMIPAARATWILATPQVTAYPSLIWFVGSGRLSQPVELLE